MSMESENPSTKYLRQLEDKYGDKSAAFKTESPTVMRYLEAIQHHLSKTYVIDKVLGRWWYGNRLYGTSQTF